MSILKTFPDPDKPKSFYLDRVRRHREADELIRGTGWDGHRGCAVGCTLERYDHNSYEELLGVPVVLSYLEDFLFENLPEGHESWPERFLKAIPEGADLSGVYPAWCVRMLGRCVDYIGPGDEPWRSACRTAVTNVRALLARPDVTTAELHAAGAAGDAARADAWAAAGAAWAAAWKGEIQHQADDLLELLATAPMVQ